MEVTSLCGKVHTITHKQDKSAKDGNLWTVTAVCSCGFQGTAHAAYNDDQMFRVRRDGERHLEAMKNWVGQPEPIQTPNGDLIHQSTD